VAAKSTSGPDADASGVQVPPIQVTIQLVGIFRIGRFREAICEYPFATCVNDVLEELRLSMPLFGTVLINGKHAGLEDQLADGDIVCLLPFLDGG